MVADTGSSLYSSSPIGIGQQNLYHLFMKISLAWLSDFVDLKEKDPEALATAITAQIAEVDAAEQKGALLNHCCVGKVLSVSKHSNADKLSLCDVQTDKGVKRVVCGGTNLRVGMRVALAHVGARVRWHGEEMMTLEKTKIRGEESEGMICAAEELDLAAEFPEATGHNIVDLGDGDDGVGTSLKEFLGLDGAVLHIDNHAITHRADLFSHVGFARELVAIGLATWKKKRPTFTSPKFGKGSLPFKLKVQSKELMPRYLACLIEIDSLGETPEWMKTRLASVGWRPVNLPVDITNFVATEVGVPLHSFDADDIKGDVSMRTSKKGEKITTLDGVERTLPEGGLVLSDDAGIFDLLGIMGGLRSSTKSTTKRIYLHSASLHGPSIRKTVIATGHRTDAATVYEKGVPHITTEQGFNRAIELFLNLVPGARVVSKLETYGDNGKAKPITLLLEDVTRMLGVEIDEKTVKKIFTDLEFTVSGSKGKLSVTPPLHRLGDIRGVHDLFEEVGRVYGYNKIPPAMPSTPATPPHRDPRAQKIRHALKEEGFFELVPLALLGPGLLQKAKFDPAKATAIENPLGEELSLLRPSTLPGLLEHAEANLLHTDGSLAVFCRGHIFGAQSESDEFGFLLTAGAKTGLKEDPFLRLKASLEHALSAAGYDVTIEPAKEVSAQAHPGRAGDIILAGKKIGHIFEVHPSIRSAFDLPHRAAAATVNVDALFALDPTERIGRAVPAFPSIVYDETVAFDHTKSAAAVLAKMRKTSSLLSDVHVSDLYAKDATGPYNLTLRFTYQSPERTLTEEEVKKEHATVMKVLAA
jgi:phenylalanyl-tRNA synthetase beta chain